MNSAKDFLSNYIQELSARTPVPGGGSASALVACIGASLILMVFQYSSKLDITDERNEAFASFKRLKQHRDEFQHLIQKDAEVYLQLIKMQKKRDETDESEIQIALREAMDVPLSLATGVEDCLSHIKMHLSHFNIRLAGDLKIGCEFLWTALIGSSITIEENIRSCGNYGLGQQYHDRVELILNRSKGFKACIDANFDQIFFGGHSV